jgi:GTPase SAR1 family protein
MNNCPDWNTSRAAMMEPHSSFSSPAKASAIHKSSFHPCFLKSSNATSSSSPATSLKVVILGNEGAGKTSFAQRFVSEELGIPISDVTPTASSIYANSSPSPHFFHKRRGHVGPPETISTGIQQNPEVGLDIYELELPLRDGASSVEGTLPFASSDVGGGESSDEQISNGNLHRISIWDFSGCPESLQSVQKAFFTPKTLYIILWDMAAKDDVRPLECVYATDTATATLGNHSSLANNQSQSGMKCREPSINSHSSHMNNTSHSRVSAGSSTFNLGYDSDSDSSGYDYYNDYDADMYNEEALRVVKRKLEKDIDKKVQCWIDRIQAIAPWATILPMATHVDRLRPKNCPDVRDTTSVNTDTTTFSTEHQQKEVKKRCWLLRERLIANVIRKGDCFKQHNSTFAASNRGSSNVSRPNFQFGDFHKDGQFFPHAVAATYDCDEDSDLTSDSSIDDLLQETQTKSAHDFEYDKNFSSARDFILSTALTVALGEKQWGEKQWAKQQPDFGRTNLTDCPQGYVKEPLELASLATVMLRDVRQKLWHRSKIVQTNYFTEKFNFAEDHRNAFHNCFPVNQDNRAVLTALKSLHLSGELSFFGDVMPSSGLQLQEQSLDNQLLSEFVVLDPTWLIESIDFILQYAKEVVKKATNSRTMGYPDSLHWLRATNCPTIEKEELRRLWKNRYSTRQGLGLAEHYHQFQESHYDDNSNNGIADRVFEFMQYLLILHDVFVPLSHQNSGTTYFFLPHLLFQKKEPRTSITKLHQSTMEASESSILQDLTHSNNLIPENQRYDKSQIDQESAHLQAVFHGFVFVDTAPEMLMERVIVHTIKSLSDILNTNCEPTIKAKEVEFWKDSFRLKLRVCASDEGEEQTVEINSILLEAPECGASSHFMTCESMLLTYVRGCSVSESQELWRQTCLRLREAMQNALDEIPGIEYREGGICPHCVKKNPFRKTGTWTLSQLKSAVDNEESFLRCRHGHRTETKLNGFLHCQLVDTPVQDLVKNEMLRKVSSSPMGPTNPRDKPYHQRYRISSLSSKNQSTGSTSIPKGETQHSRSAAHIIEINERRPRSKWHPFDTINQKANSFSDLINDDKGVVSLPVDVAQTESTAIISDALKERETITERHVFQEDDEAFNSKVSLLLSRCKSKMERMLLRKNHLSLDNRDMTESQIPMVELNGTKLGHHLQSLSLSYNKLETLPESLVRCLPNLRSMNLSHCFIYDIPKRWNLPLLKKLDISHNLLIEFPGEVGKQ